MTRRDPARDVLPRKRAAYEPAVRLAEPVPVDPGMRRPASTVAGALLVLLRAAAGATWIMAFAFGWEGWVQTLTITLSGDSSDATDLSDQASAAVLGVVVAMVVVGVLVEACAGLLILRGLDRPRVLVMLVSVISISGTFVGWWVQGQEIRINTTFVTLSLDILILLALSSRSAAAYARRTVRR